MKRLLNCFCATLALALVPAVAGAVTFTYTDFQADLTIAGDNLTIVLTNNDTQSTSPGEVFLSFYFAIAGSPTLTWTSATGDVYKGVVGGTDTVVALGQNLMLPPGGPRWDFKQGITLLQPGTTVLSYGIGAAGNNSLTAFGANFNGNVTDGVDLGIYGGDVETNNLKNQELVKTSATFTFSGLTGYDEADISSEALFGFGTQPDSTGFVPEPSTTLLLGMGLTGLLWVGRRRLH